MNNADPGKGVHFFCYTLTIAIFWVLSGISSVWGQNLNLINVNPNRFGEAWIAGGISIEQWEDAVRNMRPLVIDRTVQANMVAAPASKDNSLSPAFRPVFNQVGGSCARASAIGYVFTYEINTLRNVAANVPENQYPYDFTYNFLNNGNGNNGSWMTSGWDITATLGIPNVKTYGGFGLGKHTCWVTGYSIYYNAMANRSASWFSIDVRTSEGVNAMREWLSSHGVGSASGGCLVFAYNASGAQIVQLAAGTPEAGKLIMISGGSKGGHGVTIAGYDDLVKYDYNRDGNYTNTVDLNKDGKVDVKDWEIGAVIMVNSWGTGFGNGGKVYVPYRFLASDAWTGTVYGMTTASAVITPKLTVKASLYFSKKNMIKIKTGYANTSAATAPTVSKEFAGAFNYSGGSVALGSAKTPMEVGFDLSECADLPDASYFLVISTKGGSGIMKRFSVLDYTADGIMLEADCGVQNVKMTKGNYTFKIAKPKLLVKTPNGGEQWLIGKANNITWVNKSFSENVKIELLNAGIVSTVISASAPNTGSYMWTIPVKQKISPTYSIRISGTVTASAVDISDKEFKIVKVRSESGITGEEPDGIGVKPGFRVRIRATHSDFVMPQPLPDQLKVIVYDMLGRQIWQSKFQFAADRETVVSSSRISKGFYIIRVIALDNERQVIKAFNRRVNVIW